METEIVGWLADREAVMRAYAQTPPRRRRRTSVVAIVGTKMTVAGIVALVFELVERTPAL
jgi:hypothetical protein